jgi:hypothetical protein
MVSYRQVQIMHTSKVVEVDGVFVGAAIMLPESKGWRFVSADRRARDADGCTAPTLHDAQLLARRAFLTARSCEDAFTH